MASRQIIKPHEHIYQAHQLLYKVLSRYIPEQTFVGKRKIIDVPQHLFAMINTSTGEYGMYLYNGLGTQWAGYLLYTELGNKIRLSSIPDNLKAFQRGIDVLNILRSQKMEDTLKVLSAEPLVETSGVLLTAPYTSHTFTAIGKHLHAIGSILHQRITKTSLGNVTLDFTIEHNEKDTSFFYRDNLVTVSDVGTVLYNHRIAYLPDIQPLLDMIDQYLYNQFDSNPDNLQAYGYVLGAIPLLHNILT